MARYKAYVLTDIGRVRANNEDNFFCNGTYKMDISLPQCTLEDVGNMDELSVFAVFDGMGGTECGEVASLLAAEKLYDYFADVTINHKSFSNEKIIVEMNNSLCREMRQKHVMMGSTAVVLSCENEEVQIANVGDSRAYLYRDEMLTQISVDHTELNSILQMQKELGVIGEMNLSGVENVLTQHLGVNEEEFLLEPFISEKIKVYEGDIYLLCSDGISGMVSDEVMQKILLRETDIRKRAECIQEEALKAGGKDNLTLILLQVEKNS